MATVVDLNSEVVHRYVFELRYAFGHLYWDRCGRIINSIISENEDWDFENIDRGTCHLGLRNKNLHFCYSAAKLDLSQTQSPEIDSLVPSEEFGVIADSFAGSVAEVLQLTDCSRIGFRAWHLYPTCDREDSHERVKKLKLFGLHDAVDGSLGNVSETSFRLVVERPSHMLRVAITPFEQTVDLPPAVIKAARARAKQHPHHQKQILIDKLKADRVIKNYPQFGVLVDLDAYAEDPPYPDELSISNFIASAVQDFRQIKPLVLEQQS